MNTTYTTRELVGNLMNGHRADRAVRMTPAHRMDALAGTVALIVYGLGLGFVLGALAALGWLWGAL